MASRAFRQGSLRSASTALGISQFSFLRVHAMLGGVLPVGVEMRFACLWRGVKSFVMSGERDLKSEIKRVAGELGFVRVGVAGAGPVAHGDRLRDWLAGGLHAEMAYMARNLSKRLCPQELVPGARSVICLAASYAPAKDPPQGGVWVARYARGRDYHKVLKKRCHALMDRIRELEGGFVGRAFVDSAPVMERSLAAAAGVGWIGRNGCLVVEGAGSYVLLCEIICNLSLEPDEPLPSKCKDCGRCVEACPTRAIVEDGLVDSRRCISYLTIEHRGGIPSEYRAAMGGRLFGCDACQQACPFNENLPPGDPELTGQGEVLGGAGPADILGWNEADWDRETRGSALRRASLEMFIRNAIIVAGNSAEKALIAPLIKAKERFPWAAELVDWALGRLG